MADIEVEALRRTPLADLHVARGGRMVGFAGWSLPVQFPAGIITEVLQCRRAAVLFDVSHMGQVELRGAPDEVAAALERLVPADLLELTEGRLRYTQLLNETGGIVDDLIVGRFAGGFRLVVNAGRCAVDVAWLRAALPASVEVVLRSDLALLALQGPAAASVLQRHAPGIDALAFMSVATCEVRGIPSVIARCGYTGEDGFEISVPAMHAAGLAAALLEEPEVAPAGLGARDALRLEAGLPLYGQDIDEATTPVEAGLGWSVGRRRRRAGGFAGDAVVCGQLATGPGRCLVGLLPVGRAPVRAGAEIHDAGVVGSVTSGGFSPSLGAPVALGYVPPGLATPGMKLGVILRDRRIEAKVTALPFVAKSTLKRGRA